MKKIFILLAILVLASCEEMGKDGRLKQKVDWSEWYYDDVVADDGKPRIMIMSFNVRYKNSTTDIGEFNWDNRKKGCYAMINTLRPIVMGVQECTGTQRDDLINNCPGYEAKGKGRKDNYSDEQCAIFYLKDSVSLEDYGNFWLTETPDKVSKHPEAEHYRIATWIKFKHKKTGNVFYHLNTHLDLTTVRDFEMRVIMDQVEKKFGDYPAVLTADWNTSDDDPIFTDMYNTFVNARATANTGDAYGTFNGFTSPNKTTRIDHIFYRGFSGCTKFMTVKQSWEGYAYISDHYPVYAILKF